jgi:hypothetical protein
VTALDRRKLVHVPDHHNGDCVYCRGFDYGDAWWREPCRERFEFERRGVLGRPDAIRQKIAALQRELNTAEQQAAEVE